ncbi:globin domain-containing protein [Geodermatophilus sp. CPCC 206100]|uniref:globin domain-containing protein n=1 Tax=Geodermatophilus sp. CPCC 206100 TaxID=3020054 RepID=UPI003AFF7D28
MDIPAMRASFAKAAAAGDEAPLYFYSHLFLSHPATRKLFPISMAHQRDRLFQALGDVVAYVDDLDRLVPILQALGRDHRKFGTVAEHYPAVGASLIATLKHFDDEWNPALEQTWADAYGVVAQVMIEAAEAATDEPPWWDAEVVSHERRTVDTAVMWLRPTPEFPYRAGESISLESDVRPKLWRYYSPANAPRPDGLLEIHVRAYDGGPVSTALVRRVGQGDVLHLGPPLGHIHFDQDSDRDLLLVAGGTGLAPLKAVVDQVARHGPPRRVDLFVGSRTEERIYDRADLERLDAEHPWLTVTFAVSGDDLSPLEQGDVGEVVVRHGPWTSRDVYVAGPAAMVEDTTTRLVKDGVRPERIRSEVFAPSRLGPSLDGEVTE